jgi:hypothetical protein
MQTATVNQPISYTENAPQLPEDEGKIREEANRFVFSIGDFIQPGDKRQIEGGWAGGLRIGSSQVQGAPTMWRTNYIINRAVITPLETRAVMPFAGADPEVDKKVIKVGDDVYLRQIVPGRDIMYLTDEEFTKMGVVEISQLADKDFLESRALNRHFFPELDNWLSGKTEMPVALNDYRTIIEAAKIENDVHAITQDEMLRSVRSFETYATEQIEKNFQIIEWVRSSKMGGYTVGWSQRTRLFAQQLGVTLKDDRAYGGSTQVDLKPNDTVPADLKIREIEAMEKANELRMRELEILEQKLKAESEIKQVTKKEKEAV